MSKSVLTMFEQILRGICFLVYLISALFFIIIESAVQPFYPKLDALVGNYFSRNFKKGTLIQYFVQFWNQGFFQMFGINIIQEFKAEPPKHNKDNAIIMFSHGSNLDPFLIQATYPFFAHFVGKKSLFKIPIFGTALKNVGQIPIDRENLSSAIATLSNTANLAISEHKTIAIAPEGTRRRSPSFGPEQLLPFKKGPFHLAKAVQTDIIPCAIIGSNRLWRPGQVMPSPGTVIIKYLERIPKEFVEKNSMEEVQAEVRRRIAEETQHVSDQVIYNTENKPYKLFICIMIIVSSFWAVLLRNFY